MARAPAIEQDPVASGVVIDASPSRVPGVTSHYQKVARESTTASLSAFGRGTSKSPASLARASSRLARWRRRAPVDNRESAAHSHRRPHPRVYAALIQLRSRLLDLVAGRASGGYSVGRCDRQALRCDL